MAGLQKAATHVALQPFAPSHVKGRRGAAGMHISWIRRTRIDGDGWDGEVPLGEDIESYEVDIMAGAAVKRTLSSSLPSVVYGESDELADFGSLQSSLDLHIYQRSALVGRGRARKVTLHV